jgi:hypothetical protein
MPQAEIATAVNAAIHFARRPGMNHRGFRFLKCSALIFRASLPLKSSGLIQY